MKKSIISVAAAALSLSLLSASAFAQITTKLPAPGEAPAGSPVAKHGALKVGLSGGKGAILDKDNNPVVLRGMSFFWANSADGALYYNDNVVGWLAHDFRVSVVRAAIGADQGGGGGLKGYADGEKDGMLSKARAVIEACIKRGVYVIADWHVHNTSYATQARDFFSIISSEYGKYPNVLFEPFNEPLQGVGASTVKGFVDPLVAEIRKNSDNLVLVGSGDWSQKPNDFNGTSSRITDSKNNTAYTFHFYTNTHPYSSLGGNVSSALNSGLAVLVTEFGTVNSDGDGSHNGSGTDTWLDTLERWNVGWVNWSVTHKNEGASILSSNGSASPSSAWALKTNGTYIKGRIYSKNNTAYSSWAKTYPINVAVAEGNGSVIKKVGNAVNNGPYTYGDKVSVIAVPEAGWQLDRWEGDATGGKDTLNDFIVRGVGVDIKAYFVPATLIKNGNFTQNTTGWEATGVTLAQEDGTLKVTINSATSAAVRQFDVKLEQGKKYTLSFRAKASTGSVSVVPRMTSRTGTAYWDGAPVALTTAWTPYTVDFNMCSANDATARFWLQTNGVSGAVYYVDDIMLDVSGAVPAGGCQQPPDSCVTNPEKCNPAAILPVAGENAKRAVWSVSRAGGALLLRGPAEPGAVVSLYDVRGKMIRSATAADGLTLGAGVPAGNYFVVVKSRAGREALRTRVMLAR